MTLLIFSVDPAHGVSILTDSLVTNEAGSPLDFTGKTYWYPHLETAMVTTGRFEFSKRWNHELHDNVTASSVVGVDSVAPDLLRDLHARLENSDQTSTVYHFGLTAERQVVAYAYRSIASFESERLHPGRPFVAVKPEPEPGTSLALADLDDMLRLAVHVRQHQDSSPPGEKPVYIGGDLHLTQLTAQGDRLIAMSTRLGQFEDRDEQWLQILDR